MILLFIDSKRTQNGRNEKKQYQARRYCNGGAEAGSAHRKAYERRGHEDTHQIAGSPSRHQGHAGGWDSGEGEGNQREDS